MKNLLLLFTFLLPLFAHSQKSSVQSADTINPPVVGTYVKNVYTDTNCTSDIIVIQSSIPKHLHRYHTEQVYVISGTADMLVGDKTYHIKAGDIICIPANTPHAITVTSTQPLKVLAIHAPKYDGTDKVPVK